MLFCSLDTADLPLAEKICSVCEEFHNRGSKVGVKFGYQFIFAHGIPKAVELAGNIALILDLKLHDIPNTVARGLESIRLHSQSSYITTHIEGGRNMMLEATSVGCKLLGVTVLTSLEQANLKTDLKQLVLERAKMAVQCGLHGLVCSGQEAAMVRQLVGPDPFILVPGVRLDGKQQDQKRITTPAQAMANGANAVVIGREIIAQPSKEKLVQTIDKALKLMSN